MEDEKKMMGKRVNKIVVCLILGTALLVTTACGKNADDTDSVKNASVSANAVSEATDISADVNENETEENEMLGMFHDGETLLIFEEDGTFAEINAGEQYCAEGTYCISGNTAALTYNETSGNIEGKFENGAWVLDGINYTRSGIQGSYINEVIGDGIMVMNDNTFVAYKDFKNKMGKIIGSYERVGYTWKFISPGIENGYLTGIFDGEQWLFDGDYYERSFASIAYDIAPAIDFEGIYVDEEPVYVLERRVKNLSELGFTS